MNLVIFSQGRSGRSRHFDLAHPVTLLILVTLVFGSLGAVFALGLHLGQTGSQRLGSVQVHEWGGVLSEQKAQIAELRQRLQERVDAMAVRIARLDAHVVRVDALGKRLTAMAKIDPHEFNFDDEPSVGGPDDEEDSGVSQQIPDLSDSLAQLEQRVELRDTQLAALENVIMSRSLNEAIHPEGRPVVQGFISSYFGEREDPFTGHEAFHKGIDFAGTLGAPVVAVAAGVVTWAGERSGYGNLIEINHGKGYVTRYAHNEQATVKVGDTVSRGQTIALMGSTGHSTGPHVHFELLRNGRQINPLPVIGQQNVFGH
jgi:murein DD-endopeptidase MepM/ murein hydrolase activator NlpD